LDLDENSDDRTEYASVQVILYGPCLLAGHTASDWDIKNVAADSLSEWITPISPAHNDHLVTFSQLHLFLDQFKHWVWQQFSSPFKIYVFLKKINFF
jgi:hypothetical protein